MRVLRKIVLIAAALVGVLAAGGWLVYRYVIFTRLPEAGAPLAVQGPYEVIAEPAHGSPVHLVYRPVDLSPFPGVDVLPVVIWANGGCVADGSGYAAFVTTLASYGFLVVTSTDYAGSTVGLGDFMGGMDWAEAENARAGSPLAGRIATSRMGAMGQSCGATLTLEAASDPRLSTIGVWNFGSGGRHDVLDRVHTTALYINGHSRNLGAGRSEADYEAIDHVPVFYGARRGGGHLGTMTHAGGGEFANVGAAWLMWQLKGDEHAGEMFIGPDCTLCTDSNWIVRSKGWPSSRTRDSTTG